MRRRAIGVLLALFGCGADTGDVPGLAPPATAVAARAPHPPVTPTAGSPAIGDIWAVHDRMVHCLVAPRSCAVDAFTAPGSPAQADWSGWLVRRLATGFEAVAPRLPPQRALLRQWPTADAHHVTLCWVDDLVLQDVTAGRDFPVVVDDTVRTSFESWVLTVQQVAPRWRLAERVVDESMPGIAPWCR